MPPAPGSTARTNREGPYCRRGPQTCDNTRLLQLQPQLQPVVAGCHPARTAEGRLSCITAGHGPVLMAEDGGFEPPRACTQHAFQLRVPVSVGVGRRPSAQVNTGRPTRTDAPRRPRTRRNCNRNCNRSGAVVAPIRAAGLIGRSVFRRTFPGPGAPGSRSAPRWTPVGASRRRRVAPEPVPPRSVAPSTPWTATCPAGSEQPSR